MIDGTVDRARSVLPGRMIGRFVDWAQSVWPWGTPTASLDEDVVFDALANRRRRAIFRLLVEHDHGDGLELTELADYVAAIENDLEDVDGLSEQQAKRVYVSLYQTHIPNMAQDGLLEYDEEEGQVWSNAETVAAASTLDDADAQIEREVIA